MEREVRIQVPEGMEIDSENSTFECIKFKPIEKKRWRNDKEATVSGYFLAGSSRIYTHLGSNDETNYNIFKTKKQAKSALAMARISQIMANDERFGGVVTDEEWSSTKYKYTIRRCTNTIFMDCRQNYWEFLAFHTKNKQPYSYKKMKI